jgi:hypothetical protein
MWQLMKTKMDSKADLPQKLQMQARFMAKAISTIHPPNLRALGPKTNLHLNLSLNLTFNCPLQYIARGFNPLTSISHPLIATLNQILYVYQPHPILPLHQLPCGFNPGLKAANALCAPGKLLPSANHRAHGYKKISRHHAFVAETTSRSSKSPDDENVGHRLFDNHCHKKLTM